MGVLIYLFLGALTTSISYILGHYNAMYYEFDAGGYTILVVLLWPLAVIGFALWHLALWWATKLDGLKADYERRQHEKR